MTDSNNRLKDLVRSFFDDYLNVIEESDSGREFNIVTINCTRALKIEPLNKLLLEMKQLSHEDL